jgi:hypothetical protein
MNVAGIITELRSELQEIDDAIRSLERFNPLTGAAESQARSVIEIRLVTKPNDAS